MRFIYVFYWCKIITTSITDLKRSTQTEPNWIFAMDLVWFSICQLLETDGLVESIPLGVVFEVCVPVLVSSILPCSYFLSEKREPLLSFCVWHGSMDIGLVTCLNVIFWRFFSLFYLSEILMTWIWIEGVCFLDSSFKAESLEVVEVGLGDCLKIIHKVIASRLLNWELSWQG